MIKEYVKFIKDLREKKGLSQAELAEKVGISRTSYISVEQGKRDISLGEIEKLSQILGFSFEDLEQKESPDYDKYRQMILAFLRKNQQITKTKLAKFLYFADFAWFYKNLHSMSGMQYRKINYGPVADSYFRLIDEMLDSGEITMEVKSEGAMMISQTRGGAKRDLDKISTEEESLIEKISKKWEGKKTQEVVDFTHKQLPYLYAQDNELVSYELFTQEDPDEIF
jgi:transcriptional regulator with XRE-family HTH domain